jgi:hypothetical protein
MPKTRISEYSTTNSANTDIESINIDEGCAPSGINNAIRELMVHLKEFQTGSSGDPLTVAGTFVASGGATIAASAGTSASPSIHFSSDTNTGIFSPAADTVAISAGGTNKAQFGTGSATIDGLTVGRGAGAVATNTAVGASALAANEAGGNNNTAVGYQTLDANTTGDFNTALGSQSLGANTTGEQNSAVGGQALAANTTGSNNVAFGYVALTANTTANDNSAFGVSALTSNTTGTANHGIGRSALRFNTTGNYNTAVGMDALRENTTASNNTAVGYQAGYSNTTSSSSASLGYQALYSNSTGNINVAVGYAAGYGVTGEGNICIGYSAGFGAGSTLASGTFNVLIGVGASTSTATDVNEIVIGTTGNTAGATGKGSNTAFINANGGATYNGGNTTTFTTTSDSRIKKNIIDNNEGVEIINQIRVRNFEYRLPEEVDSELKPTDAVIKSGVQLGVIAQELQQVCPDCVTEQSTGVLSVSTDELFWHMVNAIKQLNAKVEALEAQLKGQ